jgi:hypothetical protein
MDEVAQSLIEAQEKARPLAHRACRREYHAGVLRRIGGFFEELLTVGAPAQA